MRRTRPPSIDKRWRDREQRWRAPGDLFDPRRYGVDVIEERIAKPFVLQHHYSGSFPAARLCVGLFEMARCLRRALVGVAVFSVGVQPRTISRYTGFSPDAGVELGRLVLLDDVRYNGESFFIARALRALRELKPSVRAVVSYADPVERRDAFTDAITKRAHWGTIYKASNATFAGRSSPRTLLLARNGSIISPRAISKIRNGERGRTYAIGQLVAAGAPAPRPTEDPARWLSAVLAGHTFTRLAHPGNLVYTFGLDESANTQIRRLHGNVVLGRTA